MSTPWRTAQGILHDRQADQQYREQERAANASQPLEFPRGSDTVVPDAIVMAEYELAYSLLDGVDPQMELENLMGTGPGLRRGLLTHYERNMVPIEHLINLVPNPLAWLLIKPFLRDDQALPGQLEANPTVVADRSIGNSPLILPDTLIVAVYVDSCFCWPTRRPILKPWKSQTPCGPQRIGRL